ncbi:uncharacterized protein UTRI_04305_B [Ustilago trichophora]|uniref:LYR motif-containing protein Cup1-like N-terminal domain-containing protein n=1 Tax=Ustilago trichophora TaxID=86804 RepID=A0A5C3EEV3_9BASI|nr:uncharacterized protein UTRI_04305_B [Ustilago trichophora]
MLASTSTSSSALLSAKPSSEGLKHLYRTLLQQARLLSSTLDDPIIYTSHRFLSRKNLEPLLSIRVSCSLSEPTWPPSTTTKRLLRAKTHRRQLADANFGWEHAVERSLSLAYARTGKLRRDVLSDLSPLPSSDPNEEKYPKKLRKKEFHPILAALLTSGVSMDGAPVKRAAHLMGRPPPPWLPAEDDPLVKNFGKAMGRKRVSNANKRFVKTYLRKVKIPLDVVVAGGQVGGKEASVFEHLESRARPPLEHTGRLPKRFGGTRKNVSPPQQNSVKIKPYLTSAKKQVETYRSNMNPSERRKRILRMHGWSTHPKDYSHLRRRRRIYGRLLDDVPLLLVANSASTPSSDGIVGRRRKNDPLDIRARLSDMPADIKAGKIKLAKSRYAVGASNSKAKGEMVPRGLFGEEGERQRVSLDGSEVEFLQKQGLLQ